MASRLIHLIYWHKYLTSRWQKYATISPNDISWNNSIPSLEYVLSTRCVIDWRKCDFVLRYGKIVPNNKPINVNYEDVFQQKSKDIAYFSSNCNTPSKWRMYVMELGATFRLTGMCFVGKGKCGDWISLKNDNCHFANFEKRQRYKFYLSFENSLCKDCITEKLFLYLSTSDADHTRRSRGA